MKDSRNIERLMPALYDELRSLAARFLRDQRPGHTLQPTALVNEAYIKMLGADRNRWEGRGHFYRVAARAMRCVLVDHARKRNASKREGTKRRIPLTDAKAIGIEPDLDLLALDEALDALARVDEQKAHTVELRFFVGLTTEETAAVLGITPRSVERRWRFARAWLLREMQE